MKAYIVTTGVAFALLALAHLARIFEEGAHLITEPIFLATTVGSVGMCVWAIVILKQPTRLGS
jgi:hypothetical protein